MSVMEPDILFLQTPSSIPFTLLGRRLGKGASVIKLMRLFSAKTLIGHRLMVHFQTSLAMPRSLRIPS